MDRSDISPKQSHIVSMQAYILNSEKLVQIEKRKRLENLIIFKRRNSLGNDSNLFAEKYFREVEAYPSSSIIGIRGNTCSD